MTHVLNSKSKGVFLCASFLDAFFSGTETVGQCNAMEFTDEAQAKDVRDVLAQNLNILDLEIIEVRSGNWRDLKSAGLQYEKLAANELEKVDVASSDISSLDQYLGQLSPSMRKLIGDPVAGSA